MRTIEERLETHGLVLPQKTIPGGDYVPYTISGNQVLISGQLPKLNGKVVYIGKIGEDVSLSHGMAAARLSALNILSHLEGACSGSLDRVVQGLRLSVYMQCCDGFTAHAQVADGASEVLVQALGDIGKHSRVAVGAHSLPANAAVEISAIFEVEL